MKTQMTIGKKLTFSFAALLVFTVLLSYFSISTVNGLIGSVKTTAQVTGKKEQLAADILYAAERMRVQQRGIVMFSALNEPAAATQAEAQYRSTSAEAKALLAELRPLLQVEEAIKAAESVAAGIDRWNTLTGQLASQAATRNFEGALRTTMDQTVATAAEIEKNAKLLLDLEKEVFAEAAAGAERTGKLNRWIVLSLFALTIAAGLGGIYVVRITNISLRAVAAEVSSGATQVAGAAAQISSTSQSLARDASGQAASVEETSASGEEVTSITRKNSENAASAADCVGEAADAIADANRNLSEMIASMDQINTSSGKIGRILKVIDEIAFQTNILALNAAVEAARAGDAGLGFAVVADEVRSLAQRSAQAARDTAALVEESITASGEGKLKLDRVTTSIGAITASAEKVKVLVEEVKLGSTEQARGIEQIARALTQIERVTQTSAASAEEAAAAGEELAAQSAMMSESAKRLQDLVGA